MGIHADNLQPYIQLATHAGQHVQPEPEHGIHIGAIIHFAREYQRWRVCCRQRFRRIAGDFNAVGHIDDRALWRQRGQRLPVRFADGNDSIYGLTEIPFIAIQFLPLQPTVEGGGPARHAAGIHHRRPLLEQEFGVVIIEYHMGPVSGHLQNLQAIRCHLQSFDLYQVIGLHCQHPLEQYVGIILRQAQPHVRFSSQQGIEHAAAQWPFGLPKTLYPRAKLQQHGIRPTLVSWSNAGEKIHFVFGSQVT